MAHTYPKPGTMAERILIYIAMNPGVSNNAIIRGLGLNPSPARVCITALAKRGLIVDSPNGEGHHAYHVKVGQ